MKLKRFKKSESNSKKKVIIFIAIMILGIFLVGTSYAVYQKESEVQFINAKVRFPKANEISYTTTSNSSVTNVEEALNDLYGKLGE